MKIAHLALCLAAALASGCASKPLDTDAESYAHHLADYVVGVWELENEITQLPAFLQPSSDDEFHKTLNPRGYHPIRGVSPESLSLVVLPGHAFIGRFENTIPPSCDLSGYLLVRVKVDGVTKSFLRRYVLTSYNQGKVEFKIDYTQYTLRVGPNLAELELVPSGPIARKEEPSLKFRHVDALPSYFQGEITSLPSPPLSSYRGLPPGVNQAD